MKNTSYELRELVDDAIDEFEQSEISNSRSKAENVDQLRNDLALRVHNIRTRVGMTSPETQPMEYAALSGEVSLLQDQYLEMGANQKKYGLDNPYALSQFNNGLIFLIQVQREMRKQRTKAANPLDL